MYRQRRTRSVGDPFEEEEREIFARYLDDAALMQLTAHEKKFSKQSLGSGYRGTSARDMPEIDIVARTSKPMHLDALYEWYVGTDESKFDWDAEMMDSSMGFTNFEILYNFTDAVRDNKFSNTTFFTMVGNMSEQIHKMRYGRTGQSSVGEYGKSGFTFRLLYEFLCLGFNEGEYFVTTYFNQHFRERGCYHSFIEVKDKINKAMSEDLYKAIRQYKNNPRARIQQAGTGRLLSASAAQAQDIKFTYGQTFGIDDFAIWRNAYYKAELERVAEEIRQDIIVMLSTGEINLNYSAITEATAERRRELGLDPFINHVFYASGQLIDNMNIYINVDQEAA